MNIEKLPSGSYRVRKVIKGKRYSLTFDHPPKQREINKAVRELEENADNRKPLTFESAAKKYVDSKRNVLSPASVREYDRMCSRLPEWFTKLNLSDIDQVTLQELVGEMSEKLSAKTVKDRHAFCVSVIRLFYPNKVFSTTLPKKVAKIGSQAPYIPTHDDVNRILEAVEGTMFDIPIQLACYGMRREEICALEVDDLDENNFLTINKALVQDTHKQWVVDKTKTYNSTRIISVDDALANKIRDIGEGRVYTGFPQSISNHLTRVENELGIEHFSIHKLRHYFCTTLSENNVSESDILALGGWNQNSNVMKEIYRHSNMGRDMERLKRTSAIIKNSRG